MIKFRRNKETGVVEVWKNEVKTGEVSTMGDDVKEEFEKFIKTEKETEERGIDT